MPDQTKQSTPITKADLDAALDSFESRMRVDVTHDISKAVLRMQNFLYDRLKTENDKLRKEDEALTERITKVKTSVVQIVKLSKNLSDGVVAELCTRMGEIEDCGEDKPDASILDRMDQRLGSLEKMSIKRHEETLDKIDHCRQSLADNDQRSSKRHEEMLELIKVVQQSMADDQALRLARG